MRINVNPQSLRGLADRMVRVRNDLETRLRSLQRSIDRGSLAAQNSHRLEQERARAGDVIQRGNGVVSSLEGMIRFLRDRAAAFEDADRAGAETIHSVSSGLPVKVSSALPLSGGTQAAWWSAAPLLSIPLGQWASGLRLQMQNLPPWLQRLLGVQGSGTAPVEDAVLPGVAASPAAQPETDQPTRLGALMAEYEQENPAQQVDVPDTSSRPAVPVLAQGDQVVDGHELMGGYGCVPTSVSMILGYFHAKDSTNSAQSPVKLFNSFDADDWDGSGGMGPHKLIDEVQDLGYQTVETHVNVSFEDLQEDLAVGPVLVTTKVGLQSEPRKVLAPSSTNSSYHAMVVTGVSADGSAVYVNDPWGGSVIEYSRASFESIWEGGGRGELVIQP